MTYDEAYGYLLSLPRFEKKGGAAYHPGLAVIGQLMHEMGNPHRQYGVIHVGGTNGKGSTASILASVVTSFGNRTGLHTSPHLLDFTERMRLDGKPASPKWVADAVTRYRDLFDCVKPTFFEASVALSLLYFAESRADVAVVEVGLGGRLDATNIVSPILSVITSISLDHTDLLGNTLTQIAKEKAGIIKEGTPILTSATQEDVLKVLRAVAAERRASFHDVNEEVHLAVLETRPEGTEFRVKTPLRRYARLFLDLAGNHQHPNAKLAVRAAEMILPDSEDFEHRVAEGTAGVRKLAGLRGRSEIISDTPLIVADVAHNPEGLRAAARFVQDIRRKSGRLYALFGVMRDKDVMGMIEILRNERFVVMAVAAQTDRAMDQRGLMAMCNRFDIVTEQADSVEEGVSWFLDKAKPNDAMLITGSHAVVAEALTSFD